MELRNRLHPLMLSSDSLSKLAKKYGHFQKEISLEVHLHPRRPFAATSPSSPISSPGSCTRPSTRCLTLRTSRGPPSWSSLRTTAKPDLLSLPNLLTTTDPTASSWSKTSTLKSTASCQRDRRSGVTAGSTSLTTVSRLSCCTTTS